MPRAAKIAAMMNSGASDANGASHCTSRNWSTPNCVPALTRLLANGSAHSRMTEAARTNIVTTVLRRRCLGSMPIAAAVPTRSGSSASPRLMVNR
ncbi:Uncharacterised protein [Mycobacteroides abscessus subsp. abscessus]|nr:Uncharacterised protein [Mycobacteroides abscessus subsp. abscessus]